MKHIPGLIEDFQGPFSFSSSFKALNVQLENSGALGILEKFLLSLEHTVRKIDTAITSRDDRIDRCLMSALPDTTASAADSRSTTFRSVTSVSATCLK